MTEDIKYMNVLIIENGTSCMYQLPTALPINKSQQISFGINHWWSYNDSCENMLKIYDKGIAFI